MASTCSMTSRPTPISPRSRSSSRSGRSIRARAADCPSRRVSNCTTAPTESGEGEAEAREVLPEPVGVVRRALLRARDREENPPRFGEAARLLADAHHFGELNLVEAIERADAVRG